MPASLFTSRTIFVLGLLSLSAIEVSAADRTTEAGEATVSDPNAECIPYGYDPVTNAIAKFPSIWDSATIIAGDTAAANKWASIQASVPNTPPKGTLNGNITGINYPNSDPDCWWTWNGCVTPKAPGLVADIADMPEPHTLGYGFDDGPNCSHNAFYDYLTSQNQKATMFYIGSNVMDWPLEAQRAVADGHEICVHTWSHQYMTAFASEDAFAELWYTMQAIKLVTGVTPTCWRPPFGDVDDRIRAIAQGLGLRTIIWKYDSEDWQVGSPTFPNTTPQSVDGNYQKMIDDANNGLFATGGAIILAHELNGFTMSEAMKMYPLLKKAFANIVPVGVGLNISQPYLESNYTLPSFAQYVAGTTKLAANSTTNTNTALTASGTAALIGTATNAPAGSKTTTTSATAAGNAAATVTKKPSSAIRERVGVPLALVLFVAGILATRV